MLYICCRGFERRTDFRFLAVHTCVISSFPSLLSRIIDSTNPTTSSPRNLACRYITELSQWKAVAYTGHIPGHSGLRCRSIYRRTLEPLVCASDMPPPASPSRVHPTRWERICRHCDAIHACECSRDGRSMIWHSWQRAAAFPYTKYRQRLCAVRHSSSWWRWGAWTRSTWMLHASPDVDIDNHANLHVWAACGRSGNQDSYRPTYMYFSTVACASPRPVVPLPHIYRAVMLIFDLVDIPVSPAADSPNPKVSSFRKV